MKASDAVFRIQLADRRESRKLSGIIPDKGSRGSPQCRSSEREILFVDLAVRANPSESGEKLENKLGTHARSREISCETIDGQMPLTFKK